MKKLLFFGLFSLSLFACEKEISVDLNTADPKIVVEATLNDQESLATVKLSKTVNFSDPNAYPAVSGAEVVISDNAGNSWICSETASGIYQNTQLLGVVDRTYTLSIKTSDGQLFTASSTLPAPVAVDSFSIVESTFPGANNDTTTYFVIPRYLDPIGVQNNYRFIQSLNGAKDLTIIVRNDNVFAGTVNEQPLFSQELEIHSGDVLDIEMMGIDRGVYDYFFSLNQSIGSGPDASGVPSNPVSNIRGGALGYFSAFSVQKFTVVIP